MKKDGFIKWKVGALIMLGAVTAYAQTNDNAGAAATAENYPQSAKQIRRADHLLAKQIRKALVHAKGLDSGDVVVSAKGSVVTLGGSVPEASQIPLAVATAKEVKGVTEVHDAIRVKAPGQ